MGDNNKAEQSPRIVSLRDFLEKTPPGTWEIVTNPVTRCRGFQGSEYYRLDLPALELYCDSDQCDGLRLFEPTGKPTLRPGIEDNEFLIFQCKNCEVRSKKYAIVAVLSDDFQTAKIFKYGEKPSFGPPTPKRVQALLGEHREHYFKGRRAENQGMGIAAFAYYRRVIEGQKDRIFDELIKVCSGLKASPELIAELDQARAETQFKKAIESIKHGIPDALLVNGENPLALLHSALSEGLHNDSDEACLELATSIRIVMADLAERMSAALKEDAELKKAVARLVEKKGKPTVA